MRLIDLKQVDITMITWEVVDLMDHLTSYYQMTFRTNRQPTRVILLFTMGVAKARIEYRKRQRKKGMKVNQILELL